MSCRRGRAVGAAARGLAKYDQTLAFYSDTVRPAMVSSALGPLLIRFGEIFPVVGRHLDYPSE